MQHGTDCRHDEALIGASLPLCYHSTLSIRAAHIALSTSLLQAGPVTFVKMNDEAAKLKGQLSFVSKIVAPFWDPVTLTITELSHLADNLSETRAYNERKIARCTASSACLSPEHVVTALPRQSAEQAASLIDASC
jgi:hypothetical protein